MLTKIAVAQLNPIVGDLEGNAKKILVAYREAAAAGADLVVAPECVLTGYPLEDLVLRHSFMRAVNSAIYDLVEEVRTSGLEASLIFGTPAWFDESRGVNNVAILVDPTEDRRMSIAAKYELPNYGVFDEKRIFAMGPTPPTAIEWRGCSLGLMVCEDAWLPRVSGWLKDSGAKFLISINGSPFEVGKNVTRINVIKERIAETGLPFLYVNMVGGQDELVFDGTSYLYDKNGIHLTKAFTEGLFYFDTEIEEGSRHIENGEDIAQINDFGDFLGWSREPAPLVTLDKFPPWRPTGTKAIYQALVLGLRDYMVKQNFKSVVIGYSGGVDSGLVAALACDAIGPENVLLIRLPSKFSSAGSLTDAAAGAQRLGTDMRTVNIEPVVNALREAYSMGFSFQNTPSDFKFGDPVPVLEGVADENIQARARGNILMAISNQEHRLLLTTGNKSEVSVGYSTLYGDMSGGFNPIKDCYKVQVWDLCRWRNALTENQIKGYGFLGREAEVVPEEIIVKPPSAELRADQKDEDSLPPYPMLDAMLKCFIEEEKSVAETAADVGADIEEVRRIRFLIDRNEYKRRQAAPGVKISGKIHGRDRRYPIVNKWRG